MELRDVSDWKVLSHNSKPHKQNQRVTFFYKTHFEYILDVDFERYLQESTPNKHILKSEPNYLLLDGSFHLRKNQKYYSQI